MHAQSKPRWLAQTCTVCFLGLLGARASAGEELYPQAPDPRYSNRQHPENRGRFPRRFEITTPSDSKVLVVSAKGPYKPRTTRVEVARFDGTRFVWDVDAEKVFLCEKGSELKPLPDRVMYILRGLPGAGKSTLGRELWKRFCDSASAAYANAKLPPPWIFSTDDFFTTPDGAYRFDVKKLRQAHAWNQHRALCAAQQGLSPLIIDNTVTRAWEARDYVLTALENGYRVQVCEPATPWKFDVTELTNRTKHGLTSNKIKEMLDRWEYDLTVAEVLRATRR